MAMSERCPNEIAPSPEHAASCPDCAAAASVAPFMSRFARLEMREHTLPDPKVIWVRATLFGANAAADQVSRPLNIAQFVTYFFVAAGWAAFLMWKWSDLEQWLSGIARFQASGSPSAALLLVLVALVSTTMMLALHTILAEE
jgi:hypothetical protein